MGDKSRIEWTDATWNPVTGCAKVSAGCKNCYAERDWTRLAAKVEAYRGRKFTDVVVHPERLDQPIRWRRPRRIFVNSMSDLFHEDVPDEFIDKVFAVMALCPHHVFQVLTKRPERMARYMDLSTDNREHAIGEQMRLLSYGEHPCLFGHSGLFDLPLPNVWLGVSVENQEAADARIPFLLETPAAVRWLSCEPLIGPLSLMSWHYHIGDELEFKLPFDWVVVGGESGPKARPMDARWVRSLRDQCVAAGVPFSFKQWGEFNQHGSHVGRRKAGRVLDGKVWRQFPTVA